MDFDAPKWQVALKILDSINSIQCSGNRIHAPCERTGYKGADGWYLPSHGLLSASIFFPTYESVSFSSFCQASLLQQLPELLTHAVFLLLFERFMTNWSSFVPVESLGKKRICSFVFWVGWGFAVPISVTQGSRPAYLSENKPITSFESGFKIVNVASNYCYKVFLLW